MIKGHGIGRLVDDPVLSESDWGGKVATFTLETEEFIRKQTGKTKKTHQFDFVVYDTGAETIATYAKKGKSLVFEAQPRNENNKVIFRLKEFKII